MAKLTVRNTPDGVHRALRGRTSRSGQSMEAEVREIIGSAVSPQHQVKLGSMLADMGRRVKMMTDDEFAIFELVRSKGAARPLNIESPS